MVRLGEVLILRGKTEEATHWLEAAGASNPRSVEAPCLAGYLKWRGGDREAALRFRERAIEASRAERPVHGVPGEGDRKPGAAGPRTDDGILGFFCEEMEEDEGATLADLDRSYASLHRYVADLRARTLQ